MEKFLLFTPGPVNVATNVRTSISKEDICHREIDFDKLLQSIENKLLKLFEIRDEAKYRAVVITGSGTAANEAILSSVVGNKNILILSNGEFGERLHAISIIHNTNTSLLAFQWGESLDTNVIDLYLQQHDIDVIAMVHHETSSGMLNPLDQIGALSKRNGSLFVVDCVSSAGAETIDMEKDNIAFCSSSSAKAIGSYPGLSFVIGETTEFEKLKMLPVKTAYLNLYKFYKFLNTYSQTPNTPAVPLFFALEEALINILKEGVANRHSKIRRKATFLREGMLNLGLKFLLAPKDMCSVLTTVFVPPHINIDILREKLRDKSIIIYEGKGCFKGRVFQVGNIGELSRKEILFFLATQGNILRDCEVEAPTNVTSILGDIPLQPLIINEKTLVSENSV
ncbi:MAG: alanine--glyoxylate aminotransferase family protein [Magnetococcales bacterium]|nr:alanine--glyoxylate aminotransferase family protein [Magnetococcales bacterium]